LGGTKNIVMIAAKNAITVTVFVFTKDLILSILTSPPFHYSPNWNYITFQYIFQSESWMKFNDIQHHNYSFLHQRENPSTKGSRQLKKSHSKEWLFYSVYSTQDMKW